MFKGKLLFEKNLIIINYLWYNFVKMGIEMCYNILMGYINFYNWLFVL